MSRAHQSRNHRRREKLGLVVLQIEVPEVELLEVLRLAGWIPEGAGDPTRDELARIMEAVVRAWVLPPEGARDMP
jgi:hypothetical protein